MTDRNREFAELTGLCWHEWDIPTLQGQMFTCKLCGEWSEKPFHPDYAADPRLVLREMEVKHPDFIETMFSIDEAEYHSHRPEKRRIVFDKFVGHILDTTGKLRDAAIEFLKALRGEEVME